MRAEKQLLLDEIKEKMNSSKAMLVMQYEALSPSLSWTFANKLAENKGSLEVVKKRIFLKAAAKAGLSVKEEDLKGHVGIIFIYDDIAKVSKTVLEFSKDNNDFLKVLTAVFDGKICSAGDVEMIAKLPSQNELRAQFLGLLEAPASNLLSVMESLLAGVMHCLENKSQKEK